MSTVQQLIDKLNTLVANNPAAATMQAIGSVRSSGVMYEIGGVCVNLNDDDDYEQPGDFGIDVNHLDQYVRLYLGN